MKVPNSLGSTRTLPLSSWLAITLLAVIAVMLIAPDVDPPETVLQGSGAQIVVHFVVHHAPHGPQEFRSITTQEFGEALSSVAGYRSRASDVAELTRAQQVLRC